MSAELRQFFEPSTASMKRPISSLSRSSVLLPLAVGCSNGVISPSYVSACHSNAFDVMTLVTVRFNALSRALEAALQREGVPNRVLNGHKFFERAEVCISYKC